MSQGVIKIALAMAFAALLPSCFGAQVTPRGSPEGRLPHGTTVTLGQVAASQGAVVVRGFHEPGDWAHRNYCGAGATQVLLSAWMSDVPDIETVAKASKLNPN